MDTPLFSPPSSAPPPLDDNSTDSLVHLFQSSFSRGEDAVERRRCDYKPRTRNDQDARRRRYLKLQKSSRRDLTSYARNLALSEMPSRFEDKVEPDEAFHEDEDDHLDDESSSDSMDVRPPPSLIPTPGGSDFEAKQRAKRKKKKERDMRVRYRDNLSVPEPLADVPSDLLDGETWLTLPIPFGIRCLVISARGWTMARRMDGALLSRFRSSLPGGNKHNCRRSSEFCILDCVWHKELRSYFVLDVMCWKGHYYYNCEVAFRFYWKQVKIQESRCDKVTSSNPIPFVSVPWYATNADGMVEASQLSSPYTPHELWFYHGEAHYVIGANPCILTLSIDRIPSLLEAIRNHLLSGSRGPPSSSSHHGSLQHDEEEVMEEETHGERNPFDTW